WVLFLGIILLGDDPTEPAIVQQSRARRRGGHLCVPAGNRRFSGPEIEEDTEDFASFELFDAKMGNGPPASRELAVHLGSPGNLASHPYRSPPDQTTGPGRTA